MVRFTALGMVMLAAACVTPEPADSSRMGVQAAPDTCGAARHAHLMNRPVSEAPPAGSIPNYRLAALDDAITMDYREDRLNIFYDRDTGRIVGIRCF